MNYIITSRTAAGKCDEATPALLISNCPRCSESAWPAAASPPGYQHPAFFHLLEKNQRCGLESESSHLHHSVLFWGRPKRMDLGFAAFGNHSLILPRRRNHLISESKTKVHLCSASGKSWSCKETGLILDFPRAFLRLLSFSQQPHTIPGRHNTSPVLPAWGMRYSLVERTQCPGEGEEWGSPTIGSSSWKQQGFSPITGTDG